ncbi:MAG: HmuY family protein [Cyclobacteriaceae bacterium]
MKEAYNKIVVLLLVLSGLMLVSSCKEDPELPDNLVEFESATLGIGDDESELTVTLKLSREATLATQVSVQIAPTGVVYGVDFTTEPAATAGIITLPIEKGTVSVSFTLIKEAGVLFDGDEQIVFTVAPTDASLVTGSKAQVTVTFSELIALSGEMEVNGGGALYPNKVFIDLSANRQTAVQRTAWDFGFSSGSEFRVILNSSNGMMARALTKTDLNAVTAADTVGFGAQLSLAAVFAAINSTPIPDWVPEAINWIDDPAGDLSKTAIAEISATLSENKVYIVNRGTGPGTPAQQLGWKKIRVIRNANGYTLQHADIGATSFSELQVTKNPAYAFQYVSLTTGAVVVEPVVDRWDIAWTGFTNSTNFGSGLVPYYFQDVILQNMTGVAVVQVLTSTITYEAFAETDLTGLDFSNQNQLKIGTSWRTGGGPGGPPSVRNDRFYVIRDAADNYYKLRFTSLTTSGERGRPRFEFALVKKGA